MVKFLGRSFAYKFMVRLLAIFFLIVSILFNGGIQASASPNAVNSLVVGSGTAASCTEAALDTALASGGLILFNCGTISAVIGLTSTKTITQNTTLDGANLITLSAGGVVPGIPLLVVNQGVTLRLQNMTLRDGDAGTGNGGALLNHGLAFLANVNLLSNHAARGAAIFNDGQLNLNGVTASGNTATQFGWALYNTIVPAGTAYLSQMTNVTFSGNAAPVGGGGIYNNQASLALYNATLAGNSADGGGGSIYNVVATASVTVLNTILGPNLLSTSNCSGTITSLGHNISSDATCSLGLATDQNSTNPLLNPLANNGGYTQTLMLNNSSPAVDTGDNSNCPMVDQRGQPRPFGPACDIGAVEVQQAYIAPTGPWYVANAGSDSNTCSTIVAPCKTINGAISKAMTGDTIYVAVGFYTSLTGNEVVNINKNLDISGGWNSTFSNQNGLSTIQGKITTKSPPVGQRGVTVQNGITASVSNFIIQNSAGLASSQSSNGVLQNGTMGGGIFVDGKLVARRLEVTGNYADYGGGIEVTPTHEADLYASTIDTNFMSFSGGGINALGGGLIVVGSTLSNNSTIGTCALCTFQGSQIDLDFGHMLMAFSTVYSQIDNTTGIIAIRNNGANIDLLSNILDSPNACEQAAFNISWGYNLENHHTCGFTTLTDKQDSDPLIGPLQNNGGLTPTQALPFYSPAVDMGYNCASVGTDQRGVARPQGPSCDAGAYEYNGFRVTVPAIQLSMSFSLAADISGGSPSQGLYNGIIAVLLPAGSAPAGYIFEYTQRDSPAQVLPTSLQSVASFDLHVFSGVPAPVLLRPIQAQLIPISLTSLAKAMTVSLSYHALPSGVTPGSLGVMWYDTSVGRWTFLPDIIDIATQTITFQTENLGALTLVGGVSHEYLPLVSR